MTAIISAHKDSVRAAELIKDIETKLKDGYANKTKTCLESTRSRILANVLMEVVTDSGVSSENIDWKECHKFITSTEVVNEATIFTFYLENIKFRNGETPMSIINKKA